MPLSALRAIIPVAHEAALDPRRWQEVSDAIHRAAQGVRIHLLFFDALQPGVEVSVNSGYDPDAIRRFDAYYGAINPWRSGLLRFEPMRAVTSEQMLPHAELTRTEFHADWLVPQEDISAGAGMVLERSARRLLVVGGHVRMRERDRYEQPWRRLLDLLGPTLRHAVEVNRALAGLRLENGLLKQGISPEGASVFVLSDDRRILFANEAAAQDLLSGGFLRGDLRQRLRLRDPRAQEALEAALHRVRPGMPPAALRIPHPVTRTVRAAHLLRVGPEVLPFAGIDPVRRAAPESVAVLVFPALPHGDALMRNFGLTPAETEVALALYAGQTLAEIAAARRTSIHTVRDQTKAILGKCNVRRQAELVGVVGNALAR